MRRTQLLLSDDFKGNSEHGGSLSKGKRKTRRPFSRRKPLHITLRSSLAVGECSLRRPEHKSFIRETVTKLSNRFGIRIYEISINSNHMHLLLRASTHGGFKNFLRSLAGVVARKVSGARKGCVLGRRFWDELAWSRIVEWGKAFWAARKYVVQNVLEADGRVPYTPRRVRRAPAG